MITTSGAIVHETCCMHEHVIARVVVFLGGVRVIHLDCFRWCFMTNGTLGNGSGAR